MSCRFSTTTTIISILSLLFTEAAAAARNVSNSRRERESQALRNFGWPRRHLNNSSTSSSDDDHCEWSGITCDEAGRVTEMSLEGEWRNHDIRVMDFAAFPHLTRIHLASCGLYGMIPNDIGNYLSKLTHLNLSHNQLDFGLRLSLANLSRLQLLDLSDNYYISRVVPPEIGSLSCLTHLRLSRNDFKGELPLSLLANLTELTELDISFNEFSGVIPPEIGSLSELTHLDLSYNQINGSLPSNIGGLTKLQVLNLAGNGLEGYFEVGVEKLPSIKTIDLSQNPISGEIPKQFGYGAINAPFLNIDLSFNNLSGRVPKSLSCFNGIDLSHNNLEGPIPRSVWDKFREESFQRNPKLHPPKGTKIGVEVLYYAVFVLLVLFGIYFILLRNRKGKKAAASAVTPDANNGDIFKIWNYHGKIAYQDVVEVTADFDFRYCIGTGGYGSVYRAQLPSTGKVVAVKKLHRFEGENPNYDMCFRNEAEVLSTIRHRHIVQFRLNLQLQTLFQNKLCMQMKMPRAISLCYSNLQAFGQVFVESRF